MAFLYELGLCQGKGLPYRDFAAYFNQRDDCYVEGDEVGYANDDTGVYFYIDFMAQSSEEDDENRLGILKLYLPLPLPSYFATEAAAVLSRAADQLNLKVCGARVGEDGVHGEDNWLTRTEAAYNQEQFLSLYKQENRKAHLTLPSIEKANTLSAKRIDEVWRWNTQCHQRRQENQNVEIPAIAYYGVNKQVKTGVSWHDGEHIVLPSVDFVIIMRKQILKRSFMMRRASFAVLDFQSLVQKFNAFGQLGEDGSFTIKSNDEKMYEILRSLPKDKGTVDVMLSNDQVFEDEFFSQS